MIRDVMNMLKGVAVYCGVMYFMNTGLSVDILFYHSILFFSCMFAMKVIIFAEEENKNS